MDDTLRAQADVSMHTTDLSPSAFAPATAGRWARRGWMATTALLAIALVLNAVTSYIGSRRAVDGLNRGQADFLGGALREHLAVRGTLSDSEVAERFLAANESRGLRYVALAHDSAHAGTSAIGDIGATPPPRDSASGRIPLLAVGNRLRAYVATSMPASSAASYMVIEFQPTAAARLMHSARRALLLAITGAVVLSFAGLVFSRTSLRYEETRLRLEQQRHLALLGEMSAVLAHEIRNPLASLKGHAQLAVERVPCGSRERTCIEYVIESAVRLETLTSDLLSFARSGPAELTAVDPVELMRSAARDVFGDDVVDVDDVSAPAQWLLDVGRVRQAVVNLLDNARQISPPGAPPSLRVAQRADHLVFEVRDFGPGLPAGREARIFDAFFTTRANGTGLGLAIASRVAESHGGEITAANHADGGAVFRLIIPNLRG
jgi:two-component system, NtrC family, sensor histidine kinase HydH